ncbi:MAG: hypothetical protein FJ090_04315 [Deltaproteobacteria bacterium]|nr:hypothetical protein [Deltaproteobacteria bacterium]
MWWIALATLHAEPVDRVLVFAGDRIVTEGDVAFEAFFSPHDASPVPAFEDEGYPVEEKLVDIALARALAGDLAIFRPSDAEVRARLDAFLASFAEPEEGRRRLMEWGFDGEEFMGFLYSRMVAERCVLRSVVASDTGADWTERYAAWTTELRSRSPVRRAP